MRLAETLVAEEAGLDLVESWEAETAAKRKAVISAAASAVEAMAVAAAEAAETALAAVDDVDAVCRRL